MAAARIRVSWSVPQRPLSERAVRAAVNAALEHGGRPGIALEVVLVDDAMLAALHGRFLGDPSPTDVLAFDLGADDDGPAGEIYASIDCARRVARLRGVAAGRELALYLVHGALHLCGYDDTRPEARRRMRRAESLLLNALGYAPDTGRRAARVQRNPRKKKRA